MKLIRRLAGALLALAAIVMFVAPSTTALAAEAAPVTTSQHTQVKTVNAVWRGAYYYYNDCDLAGYSGILNGWWTGYICQYRVGSSPVIWDLYA